MTPDARSVILKPMVYGNSQTVMDGGMKARGMFTRVPGAQRFLIAPRVSMDEPMEMLMGEEDLEGLDVDG
jgi:hypothetical protein